MLFVFRKICILEEMEQTAKRENSFDLSGGTGFYIQSVLYNIDFTENDSPNDYPGKTGDFARKKGRIFAMTLTGRSKSALQ